MVDDWSAKVSSRLQGACLMLRRVQMARGVGRGAVARRRKCGDLRVPRCVEDAQYRPGRPPDEARQRRRGLHEEARSACTSSRASRNARYFGSQWTVAVSAPMSPWVD